MSFFPHYRLFLGTSRAIVISGPHIQVIDSQSGDLIHSTVKLEAEDDALLKTGLIRCAAADDALKHVITVGDDKKLKVWQVDGLKLLSERELPKKPTEMRFTRDGQTILVSDKFGDVFSYPLHPEPTPASTPLIGASQRGTLTSHENPSNGNLVLGHVSLLTCFLLSPDEKYIITADRDEHVRVSWYPQGYVIERYCLGHEKFISAIHIPDFAPSILVSGGGDPMLKVWDWMSGALLSEIPVYESVKSYIKVRAPKTKWDREEGEGGSVPAENTRQRMRGRKGKGKDRKGGEVEGTPEIDEQEDPDPGVTALSEGVDEGAATLQARESSASLREGDAHPSSSLHSDRLVFVLHKIRSLDLGARGRFLIFSAVGATALFYCDFPEKDAGPPPAVQLLDFGRPIIDFIISLDGITWVLLDATWGGVSDTDIADETQSVKMLSWDSGIAKEVALTNAPALLLALQSTSVVPATPEDLKALDLYSPLSSMPKNVDPEHDPLRRDLLSEVSAETGDVSQAKRREKELTQRELARLKKKRALADKLQEQAQATDHPRAEGDKPGEEQRNGKRAKSETDTAHSRADHNAMDES
ncbi:hypothetical protein AcV5_002850 [Taiwanofungus camphoratus]|nr:hypothetical protein AcV5_002850 [Antrodia cinnamomea]